MLFLLCSFYALFHCIATERLQEPKYLDKWKYLILNGSKGHSITESPGSTLLSTTLLHCILEDCSRNHIHICRAGGNNVTRDSVRSRAELFHTVCLKTSVDFFLHVENRFAVFATPVCLISNTPLENFKHFALFRYKDVYPALKECTLPSRIFCRQIRPWRQNLWGWGGICYSATFHSKISVPFSRNAQFCLLYQVSVCDY